MDGTENGSVRGLTVTVPEKNYIRKWDLLAPSRLRWRTFGTIARNMTTKTHTSTGIGVGDTGSIGDRPICVTGGIR